MRSEPRLGLRPTEKGSSRAVAKNDGQLVISRQESRRSALTAALLVIPAEAGIQIWTPDRVRGDEVHSRSPDRGFSNCYGAMAGIAVMEPARRHRVSCRINVIRVIRGLLGSGRGPNRCHQSPHGLYPRPQPLIVWELSSRYAVPQFFHQRVFGKPILEFFIGMREFLK
jgi:hypothetical protein